jgi:hypothetical protein
MYVLSCLQMPGHVGTLRKEMSANSVLGTHILWTLGVFVDIFWTFLDIAVGCPTFSMSGQNRGQMSGTRTCRGHIQDK